MIRLVPRHHLIARDAIRHRVHDGPLRGCAVPASLGFWQWKLDDTGTAEVHVKLVVLDEDAAPDDLAGFADAFDGSPAEAEVHRGLSLAAGVGPAAGEV